MSEVHRTVMAKIRHWFAKTSPIYITSNRDVLDPMTPYELPADDEPEQVLSEEGELIPRVVRTKESISGIPNIKTKWIVSSGSAQRAAIFAAAAGGAAIWGASQFLPEDAHGDTAPTEAQPVFTPAPANE